MYRMLVLVRSVNIKNMSSFDVFDDRRQCSPVMYDIEIILIIYKPALGYPCWSEFIQGDWAIPHSLMGRYKERESRVPVAPFNCIFSEDP